MGRIKIDDLPEEQKISKEVMRKVMGGETMSQSDYTKLVAKIAYTQAEIEIRKAGPLTLADYFKQALLFGSR